MPGSNDVPRKVLATSRRTPVRAVRQYQRPCWTRFHGHPTNQHERRDRRGCGGGGAPVRGPGVAGDGQPSVPRPGRPVGVGGGDRHARPERSGVRARVRRAERVPLGERGAPVARAGRAPAGLRGSPAARLRGLPAGWDRQRGWSDPAAGWRQPGADPSTGRAADCTPGARATDAPAHGRPGTDPGATRANGTATAGLDARANAGPDSSAPAADTAVADAGRADPADPSGSSRLANPDVR